MPVPYLIGGVHKNFIKVIRYAALRCITDQQRVAGIDVSIEGHMLLDFMKA